MITKKFWTEDEVRRLREFSASRSDDRAGLCRELGRTWFSVRSKMDNLKIPTPMLRPEANFEGVVDKTDEQTQKLLARYETQIKDLTTRRKIVVHNFYDRERRIGLLGDSQMGSLYERLDVLEAAYDCYKREGIASVYHTGDLCDGEKMYRGHEYEIAVHGADGQVKHIAENYPRRKGMTTYFITGNHDLSFWKNSGTDIGERVAEKREDMVYLGKESADVVMGKGKRKVILRLVHPGKGTSYALSYQPQKYVESLSGGEKPHIIGMGHYHKAEMLPNYRNVFLVQTGCFPPFTKIMMANGQVKQIKDIIIGDQVLTHRNRSRRVVDTFKRKYYHQPWVSLWIGRRGDPLINCTEEHPILVYRNNSFNSWVAARDIRQGDFVLVKSTLCLGCGSKIPFYRKYCPNCNPLFSKTLKSTRKPRVDGFVFGKQKVEAKTGMKHFLNDILPVAKQYEEKGYRAIPIGLVIPDILALKGNEVLAIEVEKTKSPRVVKRIEQKYRRFERIFPNAFEGIETVYLNERSGVLGNEYKYAKGELNDFIWAKVLKTNTYFSRMTTVYNLEVEEDNTYLANNVVVHNCLQSQTPFMQRNNIAANIGYWILEFSVDVPHRVSRFKAEFFAVYERERIALEL